MIKITDLTKSFEGFRALNNLNLNVKKGSIYGLVGVNGSGKTTTIKHLAGIFKADIGQVMLDEQAIYDNPEMKAKIGYVADDLYFFNGYNLKKLAKFYQKMYKTFNIERFNQLVEITGLDVKRRVSKFSKGM